jgi:peptide-methionine (S)-S-oxide reductase
VKPLLIAILVALSATAGRGQAGASTEATAVLAGGCFWGVELTFEHVRGVRSVTSGFARYRTADGSASAAPVEAVQVVYDPAVVSYRQLLDVFFLIAHDPTSRDRQGPDAGPEYRAIVYYETDDQKAAVDAYVAELGASGMFRRPIVTEIQPLRRFVVAEPFHQDYGSRHPNEPYIVQNDAPKLALLRQRFPALYQGQRAP